MKHVITHYETQNYFVDLFIQNQLTKCRKKGKYGKKIFLISQLCGHATAQNSAEFAQNLEMCTYTIENSCIFTTLTCFYKLSDFLQFSLQILLLKIFKSKVITAQENQLLEGFVLNSIKRKIFHSSRISILPA